MKTMEAPAVSTETSADPRHLTKEELEAGLEEILRAPKNEGVLELLVRRPAVNEREVLEEGVLDPEVGLVGDNWRTKGSSKTPDGSSHPGMQINIMGSRVIALVAGEKERWPLAGDQLFLDLDLSEENLPPGTRLSLGTAVLEITEVPHMGCKKFVARFGLEALKFVNSGRGKRLHLRGVNARVVQGGTIRVGDLARKLAPGPRIPAFEGAAPELAESVDERHQDFGET